MDGRHRMLASASPERSKGGRTGTIALLHRFGRRALWFPVGRVANRRFAFSFVAAAVFGAKMTHLLAHQRALSKRNLTLWAGTLVVQDFVLLIALRLILEWPQNLSRNREWWRLTRALMKLYQWLLIIFISIVAVVNITFFAHSGSEMRWRNIGFAKSGSSRGVLLSGMTTMLFVLGGLIVIAAVGQNVLYTFFGLTVDLVEWPLRRLTCWPGGNSRKTHKEYSEVSQGESGDAGDAGDASDRFTSESETRQHEFLAALGIELKPWAQRVRQFCSAAWAVAIVAGLSLYALRPSEGSLTFMSWTAPLLPFADLADGSSNLKQIEPVYGTGINFAWDNKTALAQPVPLPWLPRDNVLKGFEDWYGDKKHYAASADPLRISNLDEQVLPQLRKSLADTSIKHIVYIVLESTRQDVFPIKKEKLVWNRLADAAMDHNLSAEAADRLSTLTPIANHLTGDFDDGFPHDDAHAPRGGLNFKDAYTASTYTRKSVVGTLCGIWPLVADFNLEYLHHIYQPCLPHILEAFNTIDHGDKTNSTALSKWRSHYLQSVTLGYDHAQTSTEQFGFPKDNIIGLNYLRSDKAKFGKVDLPDINYFGIQEEPLLDYIHDIFASAKNSSERVFLTHLTSTTHHPYHMPDADKYIPLADGRLNDLSHYINSVGYDDRWIGKILKALDDEGVADETLIVLTGDHGISLPENDIPASYLNPNVGCNHVPVVVSHPKLPAMDITESVSTLEILPTVLDLLRETGSLSDAVAQAATDLMGNYEGQSLIRKLRTSAPLGKAAGYGNELKELGNWQFIVMNPGAAMLGVRDKRQRTWRLVVPVLHNVEWKFTDLETDPRDISPVEAFDFYELLVKVEKKHGVEQAKWIEEAAFVARWWVEENSKRWQFGPYEQKSES